jgi:hypothetical protein
VAITAGAFIYLDKAANNEAQLSTNDSDADEAVVDGIALNSAAAGQPVQFARSGYFRVFDTATTPDSHKMIVLATGGQAQVVTDIGTGDKVTYLGCWHDTRIIRFEPKSTGYGWPAGAPANYTLTASDIVSATLGFTGITKSAIYAGWPMGEDLTDGARRYTRILKTTPPSQIGKIGIALNSADENQPVQMAAGVIVTVSSVFPGAGRLIVPATTNYVRDAGLMANGDGVILLGYTTAADKLMVDYDNTGLAV